MLSASDLARVRAVQALTFDLTATVSHPNYTDDGAGGRLPAAPTTFTVPCRRASHRSTEGETIVAERVQGRELWDITFPAGTDIRQESIITIGSQGYEVVSKRGPRSWETALVVLCVER